MSDADYEAAFERAWIAEARYKEASAERTASVDCLHQAIEARRKAEAELLAGIRLAVKERHPDIDPCFSLPDKSATGNSE